MTEVDPHQGPMASEEPPPFPQFGRLFELLHRQRKVSVGSLWGGSQAMVLAELCRRAQGPWLVLLSSDAEAESFSEDLAAFGAEPVLLPARLAGGRGEEIDAESLRSRLQLAQRLAGPAERRPRLIATSVLSLLQPIPDARQLERDILTLQVRQVLDVDALLDRLVGAGYTRQPLVERPGELSLRGDILDVFPFTSELPVRIELFDTEIESLRTFDPEDQRSVEAAPRLSLCLASDAGGVEDGTGAPVLSLLAPTTAIVEIEPLRIEDRAEGLRIQSASHGQAFVGLRQAMGAHRRLALQSLPGADLNLDTRSVQFLSGGLRDAPERLREALEGDERVLVLCRTGSEESRLQRVFEEAGEAGRIETRRGNLSRGFRFPGAGLIAINYRELAGIEGLRRAPSRRRRHRARALQSFFELKPGDLVVHAVHGLGRFLGLERMARGSGEEEHLHLEFADQVSLFVPACRIDLVQRYIGAGRTSGAPPLDRIGVGSFRRRKERVERALYDLATELLEVQARREMRRRDPWPCDDPMVREAIDGFPYTDTEDQALCDGEIALDLAGPRPMDRLLCGDVGFGKTEVALRAAFRVVVGGGQVAILVPTTLLAQQHYDTFRDRLADFPVEVGCISRGLTGKAARSLLERVERGEVDILIGTHRLLSRDVGFRNLGLIVVDEEQRFGVVHKEHFKKYRAEVDILTLSATPIPRTLHMSLAGVRDISALSIPPPGRQDVDTEILYRQDDGRIREILLAEHNRGGQVFFLHNRVEDIEAQARRLAALAPECSFAVGHGQMPTGELARIMRGFTRGDVEVLVATTIIENGLDIPAAGTILVDEADRFGLAELHQLRGRVGRRGQKAWCYLLIDRFKPMRQAARDRLKALEEMSQLGAGFGISMKDLEIRGAGNLLGAEQSGHIGAVGYDMYCRLLKIAVESHQAGGALEAEAGRAEETRGVELELGLRAFLPEDWIEGQEARIEILRVLDRIGGEEDAREAEAMLKDRFGRVPPEALALIRQFRLGAALEGFGVRRLAWRGEFFLLEYRDRVQLEGMLEGRGVDFRPLRQGQAWLMIPSDRRGAAEALDWLEGLLLPDGPRTRTGSEGRMTR